jgi:hypothetical protein
VSSPSLNNETAHRSPCTSSSVAAPQSPLQHQSTKTGTAHCKSAVLHPVNEPDPVQDAEEDDVLSSVPSNKVIDFGDDVFAETDVSNRHSLWSNDKQGATAPTYNYDDLDGFHHDDDDDDSDECLMMTMMMMILLLLVDIMSHQPGERVQEGELALDGHPSQTLKGCLLKQMLKQLQHGRMTEKKHDRNRHLAAAASFAELDGTSVDSSTYTGVLDPQLPLCLNHIFPVKELVLLCIA